MQFTHELDVVSTEYVEGESVIPSGDLSRDGGVRPVEVNTVLKGRLHLRMANIGHPVDPDLSRTGTVQEISQFHARACVYVCVYAFFSRPISRERHTGTTQSITTPGCCRSNVGTVATEAHRDPDW